MRFADVIIPLAVDGFYTYAVPTVLEQAVAEGSLVLVCFAGNKKYTGVVYRIHENEPVSYKTKPIEAIVEEQVKLSESYLKFLLWISEYYMATTGEVLKAALPVAFRLESYTSITRTEEEPNFTELTTHEVKLLDFLHTGEYVALKDVETFLDIRNGVTVVRSLLNKGYVRVKETVDELFKEKTERVVGWAKAFTEGELFGILDALKRAPAQYNMLCRWIEQGKTEVGKVEFMTGIHSSVAALRELCKKNILTVTERVVSDPGNMDEPVGNFNTLSNSQQQALNEIRALFRKADSVLLQGVTSSGKTEVYIHLIKEYIEKGAQVLYMLPEIALTVQIVRRLKRVFGERIGIYHSGMSDRNRAELWRKQCSDRPYQLILGVRSSVFLPFADLGLIIVDEEHEGSYKQKEPAPRYNGRDSAIMLARMNRAKILLGSATPSFETYHNAITGKYGYVKLEGRYGGIQMPELLFADLREYRKKKVMKGSFSPLLIEEMKKVLDSGMQVILFQNRRGYSTYMQCMHCGAIPKCKYCDVSMTYYKQRDTLGCRYCGSLKKVDSACGSCGVGQYENRTPGTERIEEEVRKLFPESRVLRMDLETMSSKSKYHAVIDSFEQGEANILVGTQMVSKGLDFERVKLVGILDADSMVNFPDFRAEERAFAMMMQVSGRSGRKGERGKVVIQTADPENRIYPMLVSGNYNLFFSMLTEERRLFVYPPYSRIIQIELRHREIAVLRNAANLLAIRLREHFGKRVCGPAVPNIGRISEWNRLHFILKMEHSLSVSNVKLFLKEEFAILGQYKKYHSIRAFFDVDPY